VGVQLAGIRPGGQLLDPPFGVPDPLPGILEKIGLRFRKAVAEFARDNDIEVIRFAKGERKLAPARRACSAPPASSARATVPDAGPILQLAARTPPKSRSISCQWSR
jgi:hypothetical protein